MGEFVGEAGDLVGSGFVPEAGGVADAVVGEGVEGGGDVVGAEVSEGGATDEVVFVGVSGVEFGGEEGDFGEEFGLHFGGRDLPSPVRPCLVEFREEVRRPSGVVGPLEREPLRREAVRWESVREVMGVSPGAER